MWTGYNGRAEPAEREADERVAINEALELSGVS